MFDICLKFKIPMILMEIYFLAHKNDFLTNPLFEKVINTLSKF